MQKNYPSLAFTPEVKNLQERSGSRKSYARMEEQKFVDGLTEVEIEFIGERDSFYMATVGANDYPYVQHRGGPKGFLKVLNKHRIGFIDFRGNMQYISVGNIATNNNVALIIVDYPNQARLKLYAKSAIVELKDDPDLYHSLGLSGYQFRAERMMVFDIEAYDWNCPQHITPRYTVEEVGQMLAAQRSEIERLQGEIKLLKNSR